MTLGHFLLGFGALEIAWCIWRIRTYDPNRVSVIQAALHDIMRTRIKPKTRLGPVIERSSYWFGIAAGMFIMFLGLTFLNME